MQLKKDFKMHTTSFRITNSASTPPFIMKISGHLCLSIVRGEASIHAPLDEVANKQLWPFLVAMEDLMRAGQLISLLTIQQSHTHHRRYNRTFHSITGISLKSHSKNRY